jgi:ribosomal protein S27AE
MIHFIYKTISLTNGKYYIGRHSTLNIDDGYLGSGKWIKSIKDKSTLTREILAFANSIEELKLLEEDFIAKSILDVKNMNFNNRSVGFPTGNLNWNRTLEARQLKSARKKGISLEAQFGKEKADLIKKKISESKKGKKTNRPSWNRGVTHSPSTRKKISETLNKTMLALSAEERKKKFGNYGKENGFFNKKHSDITISLLKDKQKKNRKNNRKTCPYCNKNIDIANYSRYHGGKCKSNANVFEASGPQTNNMT